MFSLLDDVVWLCPAVESGVIAGMWVVCAARCCILTNAISAGILITHSPSGVTHFLVSGVGFRVNFGTF